MEVASTGTRPSGQTAALLTMAVVTVLTMTTWFSASAVVPQLRDDWSMTTTEVSFLTIAVQVGFVVGALVSALFNLADVYPARRVLVISAVATAAANAGIVFSDGPETAIPLRFLTGAFLAGVYPVTLKLMATWFREGRGMALGVMVGGLTLGSAMPHFVNGAGGFDWQGVIIVTSALTLLGALLTHFYVHDGPFPFARASFDPMQATQLFTNRAVRLASIGYFGHMWELYAMWAWFFAYFGDSLAASGHLDVDRAAALGTFAVIGVGAIGCWLGGVLGDAWGRTRTTAAAMAISGGCAILAGAVFGGPWPLVLAVGLLWGLTVIADSAQFSTIVSEVCDQLYVGTALTLQLAIGFTLTVITIWLVPILRDSLGWEWTFAFLAPGPLVGIIAMLYLLRLPEHEMIAGGRG
jgi:MFS family permease